MVLHLAQKILAAPWRGSQLIPMAGRILCAAIAVHLLMLPRARCEYHPVAFPPMWPPTLAIVSP